MNNVNNNVFYQNTYEHLSTPKKILTKIVAIFAALFTLGLAYEPTFRWMVTHLSNSNPTTQNISTVATTVLSRPSENNPNNRPTEIESYIPELARALRVSEATLNSTDLILISKELTSIPTSIGNLSQLQELWLNSNRLTTLPDTIGNLSQLQRLELSNNQLNTVPESIGNLSHLQRLELSNNQLNTVPESIGNLSQLQRLELINNQLNTVPESIGNLSRLQRLWLNENPLTTLPDTLGYLSQLQELWLNFNQLTTLPDTLGNLSQLQELLLNFNQLTTLPDTLGNLSQLQRLWLNGNSLTTVPECLFRLPSTCIISIQNNPIPIVELRALQARINTPGYSGPRFHFSIYEERVQESAQSAAELIRQWGGDSNKLSHHEQIKNWLQRLERTSDYQRNPNKINEEIKSILLWMGQLSEGDTKAQAYLIIEEAVATCGDRVALARNDLSCLKKISESGDLSLDQLKNLLVGLHRLELVKKAAELKLSSMNGRDDIETHLHLMTSLKEPLNLPIETNSLLYQGMSGFSEAEIEQIKINILNDTSLPEQVISILIASPLWQKKLDTLPEMPPLRTQIEQKKTAFQEAVEGEEAEYHAEFNRLDKEEWNAYLILTRSLVN